MLHPTNMPVALPLMLDWRHGGWHRMCCALGLLSLILNLLSPNILRASEGDWIEICATGGPVMMQVELSGDDSAPMPPCPKCEHCTLCVTSTISLVDLAVATQASGVGLFMVGQPKLRVDIPERRYQRPVTRGPPARNIDVLSRVTSVPATRIGGGPCT